ncbi:translation-associated GTPase [Candidatus Woesearchaeota archaeon]|nr:translation-associated GTPase [Candidatus Woesearchaeota archaeon]|tara:strand:+ start:4424 stop:5614 length:1191 start_codon:yes stop_codon:yes gene_type:complete
MLIGVVGKANIGKSTFFKAATLAEVEIANYPFTTIKPNHGTGFVKLDCVDNEFNIKCNPKFGYCLDGKRFVPVELLDVAGLVPGAHEGKGMGNQFLDDLNQADALIHIIDISGSTNEKGESVEALSYDPAKDIEFLEIELDMWYLRLTKKGWEEFVKKTVQEKPELNKALAKHLSGLRVTEKLVEDLLKELNFDDNITNWNDENLKQIATGLRKETKPMLIACNKIDIPGAYENYEKLKQKFPDLLLIPCSAESELALKEAAKHELIEYIPGEDNFTIKSEQLNEKQKKALEFIKDNILDKYKTTGIQDVLDKAVFELLKYIAVYPVATPKLTDKENNILPDCLLVPENITALDFAFKIHTDIGNNFIKAIDLKTKKPVGKDYILKNKDVVEIVTK